MGKFTKRLIPGIAALLAVSFGASAQPAVVGPGILIDDFSNRTNENQLGYYWYFYTNLATKGGAGNEIVNEWHGDAGTFQARTYGGEDGCVDGLREVISSKGVTSTGTIGHSNYQMLFNPTDEHLRPGGGATNAVLTFSNLKAPKGICYPGVGMGTNLTKGPDPLKQVGTLENPNQLPIGDIFNNVVGFSFWAKVTHDALLNNVVKFKVETADQLFYEAEPNPPIAGTALTGTPATKPKVSEDSYFAPLKFDAKDEWQFFEIYVTGGPLGTTGVIGDLRLAGWEKHPQFINWRDNYNVKDIVKIAWFIDGSAGTAAIEGDASFQVDLVKTIGGEYTAPGRCTKCGEGPVIPTAGVRLLSNFDEEVFKPEVGFPYLAQNSIGGPWYAFNDEIDAQKFNAQKSEFVSGLWYDPQYLVVPPAGPNAERCPNEDGSGCVQGGYGLNLEGVPGTPGTAPGNIIGYPMEGKMGVSGSNGAFIAISMGSGWTDEDGAGIRGFAGIGTKLHEAEDGWFNAATGETNTGAHINRNPNGTMATPGLGAALGVWFMYRTTGMGNLVVSIADADALKDAKPSDITYSVKIPGTFGQWAAARIHWDDFALPTWSTRPNRKLDITKLAELQFRNEGNLGPIVTIAIDNVYIFDANITAPAGVRLLSNKKVNSLPMRASYSRGGINVNWNAPSQIASGRITLVNIKGATVASQNVRAGTKIDAKLTTRGNLPTGMYFVRIDAKDVNGKRIVQQVPVQIVK